MKLAMLALAVALFGCAASGDARTGDGATSDAAPPASPPPVVVSGCGVELRIDPPMPIADPTTPIHVTADYIGPGRVTFGWGISNDSTQILDAPQIDVPAIDFLAPTPGIYRIVLTVDGGGPCTLVRTINVRAPGANVAHLRLRVTAPPDVGAPPLEQPLTVDGGADADLGVVVVKRGVPVEMQVVGTGGGVPAYLRFSPNGARDAVVEAFADSEGRVSAVLADDYHTVLVVPAQGRGVPRRIPEWQAIAPSDLLAVNGSTTTGTVTDQSGPLAGAMVQVSVDGVPSTLATTDSDGRFALKVATTTGAATTVTVEPPVTSGLPRLLASSPSFDLGQSLDIHYGTNLNVRSLGGVRVQRAGAAIAGAKLMVVGELMSVGTVTAGGSATATGEVRIAVTADATGRLPASKVPAAKLSAVVTVGPGDLAVAALDTTTGVPTVLDAPAMQVIATGAHDAAGGKLPGAVLDLVPTGELALAGASPLHVIADSNGAFGAALAAGGHYDLRFLDPVGRAGPVVVADQVATMIERDGYALPRVVTIHGALLLAGTQPLPNASIQVLCATCTGLERSKPIAEAVSDETGQFTLAVPDPGTR